MGNTERNPAGNGRKRVETTKAPDWPATPPPSWRVEFFRLADASRRWLNQLKPSAAPGYRLMANGTRYSPNCIERCRGSKKLLPAELDSGKHFISCIQLYDVDLQDLYNACWYAKQDYAEHTGARALAKFLNVEIDPRFARLCLKALDVDMLGKDKIAVDEKYKEKLSTAMRRVHEEDPKLRKRIRAGLKKRYRLHPEDKEKRGQSISYRNQHDDAPNKKRSASIRETIASDPTFTSRKSASAVAAHVKDPTLAERKRKNSLRYQRSLSREQQAEIYRKIRNAHSREFEIDGRVLIAGSGWEESMYRFLLREIPGRFIFHYDSDTVIHLGHPLKRSWDVDFIIDDCLILDVKGFVHAETKFRERDLPAFLGAQASKRYSLAIYRNDVSLPRNRIRCFGDLLKQVDWYVAHGKYRRYANSSVSRRP